MRVLLLPQVNDMTIDYVFDGEIIRATIGDITDTFDFSAFPNGELDIETIITILPLVPIGSAKRENGILSVQVINFISENATENDKFPSWMEV